MSMSFWKEMEKKHGGSAEDYMRIHWLTSCVLSGWTDRMIAQGLIDAAEFEEDRERRAFNQARKLTQSKSQQTPS